MAISILLNVFLLGTRGSLDGHEVLVAQTAREMVRSGDWIHPTLADTPRYQKPPLGYWMSGAVYSLTGDVSPITARLPSVLSALLLTFLASYVVNVWYGPSLARVAGLMQATMMWSLTYGSSAVIDMTLSLIVAGGILCSAADRLFPRLSFQKVLILFWILAGLSVLAKGPIGFMIILMTAVIYRTTRSKRSDTTSARFFLTRSTMVGIPLFLLLAVGWPLAVLWTRPEVIALWMEQSVGRFAAHWGPQTRPWFYYLYQVPLLTLPWAPFWIMETIGIGRDYFRRRIAIDDKKWLLVIWYGVTLVLLSVSEGKREHYILPGLFPLSVMAALGWQRSIGVMQQTWMRKHSLMRRMVPCVVLLVMAGTMGWGTSEYLKRDEMESCQRFASRTREQLDHSPLVIQYGSNNHATSFIVDRPMKWCGTWEEVRALVADQPGSLLLVSRKRLAEVQKLMPCERIDSGESDGDMPFVFLQPLSVE